MAARLPTLLFCIFLLLCHQTSSKNAPILWVPGESFYPLQIYTALVTVSPKRLNFAQSGIGGGGGSPHLSPGRCSSWRAPRLPGGRFNQPAASPYERLSQSPEGWLDVDGRFSFFKRCRLKKKKSQKCPPPKKTGQRWAIQPKFGVNFFLPIGVKNIFLPNWVFFAFRFFCS